MPTLNQYSSRIAGILGRETDHAMLERIKDAFKALFANRIRQSIDKRGIDDLLTLSCNIPVQLDTSISIPNFVIFYTISKVPIPVRFANDAPFVYVGIKGDDGIPFSNKNLTEIRLSGKSILKGFNRYYNYANGVIKLFINSSYSVYTINTNNIKEITISSIFENPEEVIAYYSSEDSQDVELPFPNDMLESIIQE